MIDKQKFFIGVDLGQAADYTAVSVIQLIGRGITAQYHLRHLERFPLQIPYPAQIRKIRRIIEVLTRDDSTAMIAVDHTGVGRPVFDLLTEECGKRQIFGITITAGDEVKQDNRLIRIPKRDLIGRLTVAFQNGQLKIAHELPDVQTFITEMMNFRVRINIRTAHDSYEAWREGIHDDLVLSVALAVWLAADKGGHTTPPLRFARGYHSWEFPWNPDPSSHKNLPRW